MDRFKVYRVAGTEDQLREVMRGASGSSLEGSLQVMATEMVRRATSDPLTLYFCADDDHRSERDLVALSIAGLARERTPGMLVVDCDFARPGLGGLVPDVDALGFLDQILYGSSLKSIVQQAENGVGVVGAGSFAVTKRTPFLMDAFDESSRYLCSLSRCVVFVGPIYGDDGSVHPLMSRVDIPVVVSQSSGDAAVLESIEDKVAAAVTSPVWAVRLGGSEATRTTSPKPEIPSDVDELLQKIPVSPPQTETPDEDRPVVTLQDVPFEEEGPFEEEEPSSDALEVKSWNSSFPKFVTTALAVFLVGFLFWFLYLTKSMRQETGRPAELTQSPPAGAEATPSLETAKQEDAQSADAERRPLQDEQMDAVEDSVSTARALSRKPATDSNPVDPPPQPTSQVPRTATTDEKPPVGATTATELASYAGQYLIHISSFRGASRAQSDARYFEGKGYDVVVAQIDLGEKGKWYRVYVGPFETRDDATTTKITLDENPRVRSTRITKVPGRRSSANES